MSLRCSLLGHEFGGTEIERDREERGNEVVISVVELERCRRCGETRTISENTEVTQLPRAGSDNAVTGPSGPRPDPAVGVDAETETGTGGDDSGIEPRVAAERGGGADPNPGSGAGIEPRDDVESSGDAGSAPDRERALDPDSEDAEIIEDEPGEREQGAWPDVEDHEARGEESSAWPSVEGEDEGFDATTPDGRTDVEFGGGLTPQADQGAEIIGTGAGGSDSDDADRDEPTFVSAQPSPAPDRPANSGVETVLYCPNCGTSNLDERDSLRAGDICPECHKGYLAERER